MHYATIEHMTTELFCYRLDSDWNAVYQFGAEKTLRQRKYAAEPEFGTKFEREYTIGGRHGAVTYGWIKVWQATAETVTVEVADDVPEGYSPVVAPSFAMRLWLKARFDVDLVADPGTPQRSAYQPPPIDVYEHLPHPGHGKAFSPADWDALFNYLDDCGIKTPDYGRLENKLGKVNGTIRNAYSAHNARKQDNDNLSYE
jgi:hypothetical protein